MTASSSPLEPGPGAAPPRGLGAPLATRLVRRVFRDHPTHRFAVRLWNGHEVRWGIERDFTIVFRDAPTFWSLVASRDPAAFGDAYVDGRLDVEGDVHAAVDLASTLRSARPPAVLSWLTSHKREAPRSVHSPAGDRRDVRAHYDVSDDFFRLFLDAKMVYSCAYFAHPAQDLETAQERKLDLVCRKLGLKPGERFLDVGCGWGALVVWAASRYGVHAHGITLSTHQARAAHARAAAAGLSGRVTIEERDYRELDAGAFDKIASVGMIEHVGVARYPTYFEALARALRPGGLLLNHGITRPVRALGPTGGDFVFEHVFPGAEIDTVPHVLAIMEERGFEILDVHSLRPHYALTLSAWAQRYAARRAEAARFVPERTLRVWDLYLPGCRRAFEEGIVAIHQCLAAKPDETGASRVPLTREQMLLGSTPERA